jgi:hypothetical protein
MLNQVMSRWHLLALPILAMALLGTTASGASHGGESPVSAEITRAALAPYEAFVHRDAPALCADFTPAVAAGLVPQARAGSTCEAAVEELFASSAPTEPLLPAPMVDDIVAHGDHASAQLVFTKVQRKPHLTSVTLDVASVTLERLAGSWLLSTQARLGAVKGCGNPLRTSDCRPGIRTLIFVIAPLSASEPPLPPVPAAVKRAGGEELSEFGQGGKVFTQSGCEACHRLGEDGNSGPGPALTQIGAALSKQQLEHALVDPRRPMPSFKHLPAAKFKALVEFLSLLR